MVSLKQKHSGFTIVELLIVIVIIGILAGLVITTFVGVQQRARDSERQTDINSLQKQVEAYYANVGAYPTMADLNLAAFRSGNAINVDLKALADPSNSSSQALVATAPSASNKNYQYLPTPASCGSSTSSAGATLSPASPCTGFTLSAWLESKSALYSQTNQ